MELDFRLICIHSPQENNPVAELDNFYENLAMQITRACLARDHVFFALDFNAKLGTQFISGDMHDIISNGNRLSKLINEFSLEVLNASKNAMAHSQETITKTVMKNLFWIV